MSPHIGHFEHFEMGQGYIKTASSEAAKMEIRGKGTVVMDCILKDGTVSTFRLRNVLYVPQLDRPLFSWKAVDRLNKGYKFISIKNGIRVLTAAGETMIEAFLDDSGLYTIPEVIEQAHLSYSYWHQALGHICRTARETATPVRERKLQQWRSVVYR